ncbi:hypothetical protein AB0K51_24155 [Kitasatospora sp. NPDC049285]|uniref:hypothetical protein n=1 Tax=Kitasatospora sp. NPDC049285 TaxID=3157096 RepID=UPI00343D5305
MSSDPEDVPAPVEGLTIDQFMAPLRANMPRAGDFGRAGIEALGNPVPMMVINEGGEPLELFVEPMARAYRLQPGEQVMVTSYGEWADYPFETVHEPGRLTVWVVSWFGTVTYRDGREVPVSDESPED